MTEYSKLYKQKDNQLTSTFFHESNFCFLQTQLVSIIHKHTGIRISTQSRNDLHSIMVSVYNLYSNTSSTDPQSETTRLNEIVLDQASRNVLSGMAMYIQYLKDASELPIPLERGRNTTEDKSLMLTKTWLT